jgi:hypothetical protein
MNISTSVMDPMYVLWNSYLLSTSIGIEDRYRWNISPFFYLPTCLHSLLDMPDLDDAAFLEIARAGSAHLITGPVPRTVA